MSEIIRLLLVEDNPGDARLIQEYLKDVPLMNVELGVVDTLEKAQKMLEEGNIDLVLLDLGLPDSAGFETVTEVIASSPTVPVVVLTGLADNKRAMEAINGGAQDYLVKDLINTDVLVRSIRYSIHRKQSRIEIEESELKYRSLWDNSANGLAYHEVVTDDDGNPIDSIFLDVNTSFEKISGKRREDVIGKRFSEVELKLLPSNIDPAQTFWKVALTGEPMNIEFHNELKQRWFSVSVYSPAHGTFVCALQDITERKRSEQALLEREAVLNATGKMAKVGGWALDAKTMELTYSEETCRIHEILVGQVPALEDAINFYHPDEREGLTAAIQRALDHGEPYDLELRFTTAKGKKLRVHAICSPHIIDGKTVKLTGTFQDITERKRAAEALKENEARFRLLFEAAPLSITHVDLAGNIIQANKAFEKIFGYSQEEAKQITVESFTHPDDWELEQKLAQEMDAGLRDTFEIEKRFFHKDGHQIWGNLNVALTRDSQGKPHYIVGIVDDITDRKKSEEALRNSEERHRLVLSSMSDLIFVLDKNNDYIEFYASDQFAPITSPDEFIGKNVNEILPHEVAHRLIECANRVRVTGDRETVEYSLTLDNKEDWFLAALDRHQDGESIVMVARNITVRKRAEDDVKERENEYRTLVSNIPGAVYHCAFAKHWTMFFLSDGFQDISGYPASDFIMNQTRSFDSIIHPDDRKYVVEEITKSIGQRESYTLEYRIIGADGMVHWIREYGRGVSESDNVVDYLDGIVFDITEEKLAREEMTRLREVQQASFELSLALGETLELDKIYEIVYKHIEQVMDASIFIVSYYDKKTKLITAGYVITDEGPVDIQNLPPISLEDEGMGTQSQVIRSGKPLCLPDLREALEKTEYTLRTEGEIIEGPPPEDSKQRSKSSILVPLLLANEVVGVIQVQSYERNAYSQAQLDLLSNLANVVALAVQNAKLFDTVEESEDRFRLLVEGTLDGIFIHKNFVFLDMNQRMADMIGKDRADLIGSNAINYWTAESQELIHEYHRSGSEDIMVLDLLRSGGSTYRVETIGKECLYDGKKARIVATRNITEQYKAQQETKQAADTALLYLDIMSHDVRNQLQAVVMASEILEHMELDVEDMLALEIITESVAKSQKLINKVLSTRGLLSIPLSDISLKSALESSLESLNKLFDEIEIEVKYPHKDPRVNADMFIEQLLMNILENAVEYNEKKDRKLWIDIQESGQGFQVTIKDNGQGISDEKKESLFDPSRRFGGVGIHQTIRILQKYGGHISVHDRVASDPTQGAEFRLWFTKAKNSS